VLVAGLAAMAPRLAEAQTVGRRYALLVGVSTAMRRGVPRLNFVDNDIEQLERLLKRQGYEVRTVPNDRADRRRILEELYSHALRLVEEDTFVLYYAGHGVRNVEVNKKTYWLTYDAELAMLDVQGIRLEHLLSYVDDIRASRKLILLDHCFSGDVEGLRLMADQRPTPASSGAGGAAAPPPSPEETLSGPHLTRHASLADINSELSAPRTEGTAVVAAARDEAFELPDLRHGVFTAALLDACATPQADHNYKRSVLELIRFVKPRVEELLKKAGAPTQKVVDKVSGSAGGLDWYFCALPVPAAEVTRLVTDYGGTIQAWETKGLLGPGRTGALRRAACTDVLDKWKTANGNPATLSDRDHRILTAVRLLADPNESAPEQARAEALTATLQAEGF
jgi:hypothetical protein